jgi:GntR family transcriptional regulator / MocR family aminotransferase
MVTQGALARFIDDGGFARHVRKLNRLYAERRDLILTILARDFVNYLMVIPSVAGLHITTLSRSASVKKISSIVANATALGVRVQELSSFAIDSPPRAGIVLGYSGIPTRRIPEGMHLLRHCFEQ